MLIVIPNGWLAGWLVGSLVACHAANRPIGHAANMPYNQYANMPICQYARDRPLPPKWRHPCQKTQNH